MNPVPNGVQSISYFWSCLFMSEECPFFADTDPKLYYFGIGLIALYAAFLVIIIADLKFYWSLDKFRRQVDYNIEITRKKLHKVQMDHQRLQNTKARTEKQLQKGKDCLAMIAALRNVIVKGNPETISKLTICTLSPESEQNNHNNLKICGEPL